MILIFKLLTHLKPMLIDVLSSAALSQLTQSPLGFNGGALIGGVHYTITSVLDNICPNRMKPYINTIVNLTICSIISHIAFSILASYATTLLLTPCNLPSIELVEIMSFAFTHLAIRYINHYGTKILNDTLSAITGIIKEPSRLKTVFLG
jgi:hypothetical protein